MQGIRIPKGHGKFRVVWSPGRSAKRRLEKLLPTLAAAERRASLLAGTEAVAHGFVADRSPVTCALGHRGLAVTVSVDLAGWFDRVTPAQIAAGLALAGADPTIALKVCHLGAPRQGLPTSPSAANLAAVALDAAILAALRQLPGRWTYTRYADDLTVSLGEDRPELVECVLAILASAAAGMGWQLAAGKTRVQHTTAGRRVIVGVSVGETDIRAPRWMRRKLRAAQHQHPASSQAAGLAEWCKMRLPRACRPKRQIVGPEGSVREFTAPLPCAGQSRKPAPTPTAAAKPAVAGNGKPGRRIVFVPSPVP